MRAPEVNDGRENADAGLPRSDVRSAFLTGKHTHWQLLRFLLVGGLNTVFGYSIFTVLTFVGMHYPLAIGLATVAGVAFNFHSVGKLVFGDAPRSRFWRFVGVYCLIYALNLAGVHLLLNIGSNVYVANAIVLLPLSLLAFLLNRRYVFSFS